MKQQFQIASVMLSDKGRKRDNNEDYSLFFEPSDGQVIANSGNLYIVADGVGGEARGEIASHFSSLKVLHEYYSNPQELVVDRLRQGMELANREIQEYTRDTQSAKMATTLVAAVVLNDKLTIANIGDSRAYLFHNSQLEQITRDHNLVGEMVASGLMTEEEGEKSDVKNRLLRSVGGHPEFKPEFFPDIPLQPGDRILLCSDGLTRYARKEMIEETIKDGDIGACVKKLVDFAYQSGGADNITALIIEVLPPNASVKQAQRGTIPQPIDLKSLIQMEMADTLNLSESADTVEMLVGTADRTLEIAQPLPSVQKTQEISANSIANGGKQPAVGTPLNAGAPASTAATAPAAPAASSPSPTVKTAAPTTKTAGAPAISMKPVYQKSKSPSRFWVIYLLVACAVLIVVITAVLLLFKDQLFAGKTSLTPTATVASLMESMTQTAAVIKPTETVQVPTLTLSVAPTETQSEQQGTITGNETPQPADTEAGETASKTEDTKSPAVDSNHLCIIKPESGQGLSALFNQFGVTYNTEETYSYFSDCLQDNGKLTCGQPNNLLPADHSSIQITWYIVIPEVDKAICEDKGGIWY